MAEAWGGGRKVYTNSKEKYDTLHERHTADFPTLSSLFHLAASIGLREGQTQTLVAPREELVNVYSINSVLFEPLIAALHPDLQQQQRLERLMEYAEYGINRLYQDVEELQTVILEPYISP